MIIKMIPNLCKRYVRAIHNRGFTLVEVMVSVAILAALLLSLTQLSGIWASRTLAQNGLSSLASMRAGVLLELDSDATCTTKLQAGGAPTLAALAAQATTAAGLPLPSFTTTRVSADTALNVSFSLKDFFLDPVTLSVPQGAPNPPLSRQRAFASLILGGALGSGGSAGEMSIPLVLYFDNGAFSGCSRHADNFESPIGPAGVHNSIQCAAMGGYTFPTPEYLVCLMRSPMNALLGNGDFFNISLRSDGTTPRGIPGGSAFGDNDFLNGCASSGWTWSGYNSSDSIQNSGKNCNSQTYAVSGGSLFGNIHPLDLRTSLSVVSGQEGKFNWGQAVGAAAVSVALGFGIVTTFFAGLLGGILCGRGCSNGAVTIYSRVVSLGCI